MKALILQVFYQPEGVSRGLSSQHYDTFLPIWSSFDTIAVGLFCAIVLE